MKKILLLGIMLLACGTAKADLFDRQRSKEVSVWLSSSSSVGTAATSFTTTYILIDKNSPSWPHPFASGTSTAAIREIHITSIYEDIDKAAASSTTVRIGVVNFLNNSTGSVTWFGGIRASNNISNTTNLFQEYYPDLGLNTRVVTNSTPDADGLTPYLLSTEKKSGSTDFQNDVLLPTINSTYAIPDVGDIVIEIQKYGVAINYDVRVRYFSEP